MDNRKGLELSISKNFQFKDKLSKSSLERSAYQTLVSGESSVENRKHKQQWIQSLMLNSQDAIEDILTIRRTGRNKDGQQISASAQEVEIEQLKLRVFHELGWSYKGSFLRNSDQTYTDARGMVRERGDDYPELSFHITSKKDDDQYWYAASYGILEDSPSSNFGSYSYFATLDEALEFINDELLMVGRNALFNRIKESLVLTKMRKHGVKSVNSDLREKYEKEASSKAKEKVNELISKKVIQEKFHNVHRSTDISTLPDLIQGFLLPISEEYLRNAKEIEFKKKKARTITDTVAVDLDDDSDIVEADTSEIAAKSPEEVLREFEYDAMRRNQEQKQRELGYQKSSDNQALSDKTQAQDFEPGQGQGENLFDSSSVLLNSVSDNQDLNSKPQNSPSGVERRKESSGLFTTPETSHQITQASATRTSLPPQTVSLSVNSKVEDSFSDNPQHINNTPKKTAVVNVTGNTEDSFDVIAQDVASTQGLPPVSAHVLLDGDVEDSFNSSVSRVAHITIFNDTEDNFTTGYNTAQVDLCDVVEDSFVASPLQKKASLDTSDVNDDTFKECSLKQATISLIGGVENSRSAVLAGDKHNFDNIEVDVAKETWDALNRDLSDFFDTERLPIGQDKDDLFDDIDSFI